MARVDRDRVFLDANVLFSAAWREESGLVVLWKWSRRAEVVLVTSSYAVEEARVNLPAGEKRNRLEMLLDGVEVTSGVSSELPEGIVLAEKDRPILAAAIATGATHLLTGDVAHFGPLFGQRIMGVKVLRPAQYVKERGAK